MPKIRGPKVSEDAENLFFRPLSLNVQKEMAKKITRMNDRDLISSFMRMDNVAGSDGYEIFKIEILYRLKYRPNLVKERCSDLDYDLKNLLAEIDEKRDYLSAIEVIH